MPRGTVLVIDDERDLIELVRYNLEKEGFRVISALDGEAGVSLAIREQPDVVLVDLMLPGIDGLEVCGRLRADQRTAGIPLIMLTAKSSESDRVVGLEMGADDYVTKPFSPRELAARVKADPPPHLPAKARPRAAPPRRPDGRPCAPRSHLRRRGGHPHGHRVPAAAVSRRPPRPRFLTRRDHRRRARDATSSSSTAPSTCTSCRCAGNSDACGDWIETVRGFGYKFREEDEQ